MATSRMTMYALRPFHLFLFVISVAPLLTELPWVSVAVTTLIFVFSLSPFLRQYFLARRWMVQVSAPLCGVFCFITFGTLRSPDAASTLVAMVIALKLLDLRTARDHVLFLLMNLIILMFYGLYSQTLFSTFYLFVMYFIFILSLLELDKRQLGLLQDPWNLKQLLSIETLVALPLLIVLFLFFPRFTTSWGGFGSTEKTMMGFSSEMNPGQIQDVASSEEVAFRILWPDQNIPHPESLYFRGLVFDEQDGWSWKQSLQSKSSQALMTSPLKKVDYEIVLEPRFEKALFTLEPTDHIRLTPNDTLYLRNADGTFHLRWPTKNKIKIQGEWNPQKIDPIAPSPLHLKVHPQPSAALLQLVQNLQRDAKSAEEKIEALISFFKYNQFSYTLQTPTYDSLDEFLLKEKKGFCEHYAAAFATLARLMQIPSRVVVGFQGAEVNTFGSYLIVRDKYAHAWVEVYLEGAGWRRIDPTGYIAPSRLTEGLFWERQNQNTQKSLVARWFSDVTLLWDSVNHRFALMLMNYNLEQQFSLLNALGFNLWQPRHLLMAMLGLLALGFFVAWFWARKDRASLDPVARAYLLLHKKLAHVGLHRHPSDGPLDLLAKIEHTELLEKQVLRELVKRYIALRYQDHAKTSEALQFQRDVKSLTLRQTD